MFEGISDDYTLIETYARNLMFIGVYPNSSELANQVSRCLDERPHGRLAGSLTTSDPLSPWIVDQLEEETYYIRMANIQHIMKVGNGVVCLLQ